MSNVIDFNSRKKYEGSEIERRLERLMHTLDEIYAHIQDVNSGLDKMESESQRVEEAFDSVLKEYADQVGADNIPVEYLNYSSFAIPVIKDNGDMELVFMPENDE